VAEEVISPHLTGKIEGDIGEDRDQNHHDGIAQEKGIPCPSYVGHGGIARSHALHHEDQEPFEYPTFASKAKELPLFS
jgi:hypothetical protein